MHPMDDEEGTYGLVMPFVVCQSNGGPYEDDAFVAGCYLGQIEAHLGARPPEYMMYVPTPLVPQLDLVAMDRNYSFESQPWSEHPDEWTLIRMIALETRHG